MNKHFVKVLAALALAAGAGSQAKAAHSAATTPYALNDTVQNVMKNTRAAQPAAFPGGMLALQTRLFYTMQYPDDVATGKLAGKLVVRATIDKKGKVSATQIVQGIRADCDKAAQEAVKKLPPFIPARHADKPTEVWMDIPVFMQNAAPHAFQVSIPSATSIRMQPLFLDKHPACYPGGEGELCAALINNLTYPEEAWRAAEQGVVRLAVITKKSGRVGEVHTLQSASPLLDSVAIDAARRLRPFEVYVGNSGGEACICFADVQFSLPYGRSAAVVPHVSDHMDNGLADEPAEFPGGEANLMAYLHANFVMPESLLSQNINGRVVLDLTIDEDGSVSEVAVSRSISPAVDTAVVNALRQLPRFVPARHEGEYKAVKFRLPYRIHYTALPQLPNDSVDEPATYADMDQAVAQAVAAMRQRTDYTTGAVAVQFVVQKDGSVGQTRVVRSVDPVHDSIAVAAISRLGRFKPARHQGEAVEVQMLHHVLFTGVDGSVSWEEDTRKNDGSKRLEEEAEFPGGEKALLQYVSRYLVYPAKAVRDNTQGVVILRFVVQKDGSIGPIAVEHSLTPECDRAAVDVVRKLPRFKPARADGQPVGVWFRLPIHFRLLE